MNRNLLPRGCVWLMSLLLLSQISTLGLSASAEYGYSFAKKDALSRDRKKLDTDLLKLLDPSFRLPAETSDSHIDSLRAQNKYARAADSFRGVMTRTASRPAGDLVYLYVYLQKGIPIDAVDSLLWEIRGKDDESHFLSAYVEVSKIEALSQRPEVENLRTVTPFSFNAGSVTAQADAILKTATVRSTYNQKGNGVKVGVISNGVNHLSQAQASGDLPSTVTVLSDKIGGEEGIAMMEIIYDMAPGANLYFHDAGTDDLQYVKAVDALAAAGCKVIVDDVQMNTEPYFENGYIGHHMEVLMEQKDIIFVSTAGNNANLHYQGAYYDDGSGVSHDFSRGRSSSKKYLYGMLTPGQSTYIVLQWNDVFTQSGNDYDLVVYNYDTGAKAGESANIQDGNDLPLETVFLNNNSPNNFTYRLEIRKKTGAGAKTLELNYHPVAGLNVDPSNMSSVDSIFGHGGTPNTMTVGAISSTDAGYDTIANYSGQGPVTITGIGLRPKPSVVGITDMSVTGSGGFSKTFSGTSAAAPGVAAVVAQMWGAFPGLTGSQIRDGIYKSAVDLGASGFDYVYGYGRVDALQAYQKLTTYVPPIVKSTQKQVVSFNISGKAGTINQTNRTIAVTLPAGTSVTSLAPTITVSPKATVNPASGTARNFSSPVTYTVTAEDGSTQLYTVTVAVAKSSAKDILSFVLKNQTGSIDAANRTITINLPAGTSVTSLAPTITVSPKATVNPASGVLRNFSGPVNYTVTAEDGSTQAYTVTAVVEIAKSSENSITSFMLAGQAGTINETNRTITVNLPAGTGTTSLAPTFIVSAKATANPPSGASKDFTNPVVYTVTAENGNSRTYQVTVVVVEDIPTNQLSSKNLITNFILGGVTADIDNARNIITVELPADTDASTLAPDIYLSIRATVTPASGLKRDFSKPVNYTVTAEDGSIRVYTVRTIIPAEDDGYPTAAISYNITSLTNKNVIATLIPSEEVTITSRGGYTHTFTQNGTFVFKFVDSDGNAGTAFAKVTNIDKEAPVITISGKELLFLEKGSVYREMGATAKDGERSPVCVMVSGTVNTQVPGTYVITYTATDEAGNIATAVRTVKVIDRNLLDGDIIQCRNSFNPFAVYIVKIIGNTVYIRHIVSLEIFNYYKHLKWENLKQVESLEGYSLSDWVRVNTGANGTPAPTDKVWEINGDQTKHWIDMTASEFLLHGGSDEAIYSVNQGELNLYKEGPAVKLM